MQFLMDLPEALEYDESNIPESIKSIDSIHNDFLILTIASTASLVVPKLSRHLLPQLKPQSKRDLLLHDFNNSTLVILLGSNMSALLDNSET